MKKIFLLIFAILIICPKILAEDIWDSWKDTNFYGKTQAVSDEDFEKAIETKKEKKNFFGLKKKAPRPKDVPRGEEFSQSDETSFITESAKDYPIILIPVELIADEETLIPIGHYQVVGDNSQNNPQLKFYQSGKLIAAVDTKITKDDFGQGEVNFAICREFDPQRVEIIFGSLDFNSYSIVNIHN